MRRRVATVHLRFTALATALGIAGFLGFLPAAPQAPARALAAPAPAAPLAPTASAAGAAGAGDLLLTVKAHTDAFKVGTRAQEARDSSVKIWLSGDKLRRDEGPLTAIVRLDRHQLILVNHTDRTYSTVDLPLDWMKMIPKVDQEKFAQFMADNKIIAAITPSAETRKIQTWNAHRIDVELTNTHGLRVSTQMWLSKDVPLYAAYNKMSGALASLQVSAADWSHKVSQLDGFPVYQETTVSVNGASFPSREELVSYEPKPAPPGTYDVPVGFTAIQFDPFRAPQ
jgi:hypothetical protein